MKTKGAFIPGLSMERLELPSFDGYLRLQNAEIGDGPIFPEKYTIEDLAELHMKTIHSVANSNEEFHIVGMSLGGMITSVLASTFRSKSPKKSRFYFLATSANSKENRSVANQMIAEWKTVKLGDYDGMKRILSPFFSETFLNKQPEKANAYFRYRTEGGNKQSPKSFMKQVGAALNYDGAAFYKNIDPSECTFIHAGADRIFDQKHVTDLMNLAPESKHTVLSGIGHMVNIEAPNVFKVA